ncbi:MAG: hypothetical protein ACK4KV_10825 [Rhodocyclaceae bacterium]
MQVERDVDSGSLVAPLGRDGLKVSGDTLNPHKSRAELPKIRCSMDWLFAELRH